MAAFFMFGKYSPESTKKIGVERTKKAVDIVEKYSGRVQEMYALLGEHDLVLIVNFPQIEDAVKASIALNRLTGISFSTSPAISVEEFDKMAAEV